MSDSWPRSLRGEIIAVTGGDYYFWKKMRAVLLYLRNERQSTGKRGVPLLERENLGMLQNQASWHSF